MIDPSDIAYVAANMRESDAIEVWATSRKTPYEALTDSVALSAEAHVFRVDGHAAMIYGVGKFNDIGVPWLLGTPALSRARKSFMLVCKEAVQRWRSETTLLQNRVLADNTDSINFLSALGFDIGLPFETETGVMVRRFTMTGERHV